MGKRDDIVNEAVSGGGRVGEISEKAGEKTFRKMAKIGGDVAKWITREFERTGIPIEILRRLEARDDHVCQLTHRRISTDLWEADHIVPVDSGGGNNLSNLQVLCRHHNRQKSDKNWEEFEREWRQNPTDCG